MKFVTHFLFQNGNVTDGEMLSLSGVKKGVQKSFANALREVGKHVYQDDLFHYVAEFNAIEGIDDVKTIHELLLFKRYFTLDALKWRGVDGDAAKRAWDR